MIGLIFRISDGVSADRTERGQRHKTGGDPVASRKGSGGGWKATAVDFTNPLNLLV
jgi:hypothetical protein